MTKNERKKINELLDYLADIATDSNADSESLPLEADAQVAAARCSVALDVYMRLRKI